ncbi:MAG: hypothetical protein K2Y40_09525 [Reyranella sp.]|nr:hypothetical protein [Reyranella sp.]
MAIELLTVFHTTISLVAIAAGLVVVWGMLGAQRMTGLTALFLATTLATSATGFLFPFTRFGLGHGIGLLSLVVLVPTLLALYRFRLSRPWRWIYVVGAVAVLWLNVVVGIAQLFGRVAFLRALAPRQSEPPFLIAQLTVLALFILLGALAVRRFRPVAPA